MFVTVIFFIIFFALGIYLVLKGSLTSVISSAKRILIVKGRNDGSVTSVLTGLLVMIVSALLFSIGINFVVEKKFRDNLYHEICTPEEQQARHITCQQGNIKIIYDDGDITYEFLTPKVSDKNSSE